MDKILSLQIKGGGALKFAMCTHARHLCYKTDFLFALSRGPQKLLYM